MTDKSIRPRVGGEIGVEDDKLKFDQADPNEIGIGKLQGRVTGNWECRVRGVCTCFRSRGVEVIVLSVGLIRRRRGEEWRKIFGHESVVWWVKDCNQLD